MVIVAHLSILQLRERSGYPLCPDSFRALVNDLLPQTPNGENTPHNRCLEFIKHLVKWENSNNEDIIGKARKLIAAAHKFLHPDAEGDMPKVLDPFAGGGAIPLEALRLGCEAHAIDLNPVAHLIELCTLVYPQKYGQPNSRPTPDYIQNLEAAHESKDGDGLFSKKDGKWKASGAAEIDGIALTRLPLITETEYQKNPLAADVRFWGHWVLEKARDEIGHFYPHDPDGSIPVAYLWARTVKCPNPACGATIPLVRLLWLCKKPNRKIVLRMIPEPKRKRCRFDVIEGSHLDFDPDEGTMQRGNATCPLCEQLCPSSHIKSEGHAGRLAQQMMAVVSTRTGTAGKQYRAATSGDEEVFSAAAVTLAHLESEGENGVVPTELIPSADSRAIFVHLYGLLRWGDLFSARQSLTLVTLSRLMRGIPQRSNHAMDGSYGAAVTTLLAASLDWFIDKSSTLTRWHNSGEKISGTFGRQALPMVWDYAEVNPHSGVGGTFLSGLEWLLRVVNAVSGIGNPANARQASAMALPTGDAELEAVITDPPYYDAVPYSELSDFFYVWLRRAIGNLHPSVFQSPLTPKQQELIAYRSPGRRNNEKTPEWYEEGMATAFAEMHRVLKVDGIVCVMFAHKTTSA